MLRNEVFDKLNSLYSTYAIGQKKDLCTSPYFVIKFDNQSVSTESKKGAIQNFEVLVYVPDTGIAPLDGIVKEVIDLFKDDKSIEFTGNITPDYHDEEKDAYMRSIQFIKPKGL